MDVVLDCNGLPLEVGARVHVAPPGRTPGPEDIGVITRITDADGDVDDYGRNVGINPRVDVQFADCDDSFITTSTATGPWDSYAADWKCDDVALLL